MVRTVGFVAAVAFSVGLALGSVSAHADASKAWSAAKAGLPADAKLVIGVDVAVVQKTQLFATFFPQLREKPEVAKMLDTLKDTCKLDPLAVIQGVIVAMAGDQQSGAVYFAVNGIDRNGLAKCLQAAAAKDKDVKLTVKQDGNLTQLSSDKDNAYIGWIGKDVMVVSIKPDDKAALVAWMGGKGALAKGPLGKVLGKVNTSAAMWGAGDASGKELQPGVAAKAVYGSVSYASGTLDTNVHAVMASAKDATTMSDMANTQITQAMANPAVVPPPVLSLLKTVKVTAANDEIVLKAQLPEADLLMLLQGALGAGGKP